MRKKYLPGDARSKGGEQEVLVVHGSEEVQPKRLVRSDPKNKQKLMC